MHKQLNNRNVFITGERGIGKSTLLKKIIKNIDCTLGGFIQEKEFTDEKISYKIISLYNTEESYTIGIYDKKKASLYTDMNIFNIVSKEILQRSLNSRDLIILDELGFMEENSEVFKNSVLKILDGDKPVLGVLKECDTNFIRRIKMRKDVQVIRIDEINRNSMEKEIIKVLVK